MDKSNIAGVVLAGGKSSRMGQSKAMLEYKGAPLLDHMIGILNKTEIAKIYVSGEFEGYNCIVDEVKYEGPARAICTVLAKLKSFDGVLFIPVDMPDLTPDILNYLLLQENGAYFKNYQLPVFIKQNNMSTDVFAVRELIEIFNIPPLEIPDEFEMLMKNINTQKQWQEILQK